MSEAEKNIYQQAIEVDSSVIDGNGHVNNVVYVEWMQMVAMGHSATWGVNEAMEELGVAWFARKHVIEYLSPIFEGETILIRTWIADVGRVKSRRNYEFLRDGKLVAKGETEWVYVNSKTGRPARIPESMHAFIHGK